MLSIDGAVLDFKRLDLLANRNTAIHRLDPRAKVLATLGFILSVVSCGKYELSPLLPYFIFPAALIGLADLPAGFIARKVLIVVPFAFLVGMFNPFIDRAPLLAIGSVVISGGVVSWVAIIVKAALTVSAALILVATTGFPSVCRALEQMGMPQAFAVQLLFLYRYIFVLTDEGGRASRARALRSCGKKGLGIRSFSSLVGHLLLRTWQRAERIHTSMLARGFSGEFHTIRESRFGMRELLFFAGWSLLFILLRTVEIPRLLGTLIDGVFS
jgi:cobalt/nickel transport system permease protein